MATAPHDDLQLRSAAEGIGDNRIEQVRQQYAAKGRPVGLYRIAAGMHRVGGHLGEAEALVSAKNGFAIARRAVSIFRLAEFCVTLHLS